MQSSSFTEIAAFNPTVGRSLLFFDDDEALEVETSGVSPTFFDALGVQPFLGRGFRTDEDELGAKHVAVLSHSLWQQRFAGDTDILGRRIALEQTTRESYVVVGVMPRGFEFPRGTRLDATSQGRAVLARTGFSVSVRGRATEAGQTVEEARAET